MKATTKKKFSSLVQENERLKQEIQKNEQEAELLKAENLKIAAHTALIKMITDFQKNALHCHAVKCNEISEKIKKHPELPDTFKSFTKRDYAKLASEYGNGTTNTGEEAKSFAVHTVHYELKARGTSLDNIGNDPLLALLVVHRLIEYAKAYIQRHILFLKKECPEADNPDSEIRDAAFAGFLLCKGENDNTEAIEWLEKITSEEKSIRCVPHLWSKEQKARSEKLAGYFRRALAGQSKNKWNHPTLDSWLLLVWPLVEAEEWNYATVHSLASMKFPDFEGKPMKSAKIMGKHCKFLGLKIKNPKGGRPKNDQFDYENPSLLHKFALQIGDSFPDFSSFPNKIMG